jgi:micrococcal nuclease
LLVWLAVGGALAAETCRGPVVGVTDGDTLSIMCAGRPTAVRLHGVDAPERGQPFGTRAKEFVDVLAFGRNVTVSRRGVDRYGRTIGDVTLPDGSDLGQELLRAGLAWWFRRYSAEPRLAALEVAARAAHRGLWADPRPVPPWEWRRGQKTHELAPRPRWSMNDRNVRSPDGSPPSTSTQAGSPFGFSDVEQATIARILRDFPESIQALEVSLRAILDRLIPFCRGNLHSEADVNYLLTGLADRLVGGTIKDEPDALRTMAIDLVTRHLLAGMRDEFQRRVLLMTQNAPLDSLSSEQ